MAHETAQSSWASAPGSPQVQVTNIREASQWLSYTYLYTRMTQVGGARTCMARPAHSWPARWAKAQARAGHSGGTSQSQVQACALPLPCWKPHPRLDSQPAPLEHSTHS